MRERRVSRRWWGYWAAAWSAVTLVWMTDVAFQNIWAGADLQRVLGALLFSVITIAPGAVLSLVAWALISRAGLARRTLPVKLAAYILLGALYWLAWSTVVAGLASSGILVTPAQPEAFATALARSLAGFGFNGSLLFAALVTAYEARQHALTAKDAELRTAELRAELARAQMAALNAQLSPHFLFNTLHVASGLMSRDIAAARRVLADLAGLLRGSLEVRGRDLIPLLEELRLTERYLDIQKARFRDRLAVELEVDPVTLHLGVPPFLLQPLVENAIIHGISRSAEGGRVRIHTDREPDRLLLSVSDSGPGPGAANERPRREGIGLGGTRRRLELHFGEGASLELQCSGTGGSTVRVTLPAVPVREPAGAPAPAAGAGSGVPEHGLRSQPGGRPGPAVDAGAAR
jgi:two-component system, LytTR family, sensor kinase